MTTWLQIFAILAIVACTIGFCGLILCLREFIQRLNWLQDAVKYKATRCGICGMTTTTHDLKRHAEIEDGVRAWKAENR